MVPAPTRLRATRTLRPTRNRRAHRLVGRALRACRGWYLPDSFRLSVNSRSDVSAKARYLHWPWWGARSTSTTVRQRHVRPSHEGPIVLMLLNHGPYSVAGAPHRPRSVAHEQCPDGLLRVLGDQGDDLVVGV